MEAKEEFTISNRNYELKMSIAGESDSWYEIWKDGSVLQRRTRWPIDSATRKPLTQAELVAEKTAYVIRQHYGR